MAEAVVVGGAAATGAAAVASTVGVATVAFLVPIVKELAPIITQSILDLIRGTVGDEKFRADAIQLGLDVTDKSAKYSREVLAKFMEQAFKVAIDISATAGENTPLKKRLFASLIPQKAASASSAVTTAAYGARRGRKVVARKAPARARKVAKKVSSYADSFEDGANSYLPAFYGKYGCGKGSF